MMTKALPFDEDSRLPVEVCNDDLTLGETLITCYEATDSSPFYSTA